MPERCVVRTFSFPPDLSNRLDQLAARAVLDDAVATRLGLRATRPETLNIDARGLAPGDYKALQDLIGSRATGDELLKAALADPALRRSARALVAGAQRRNQRRPKPIRVANASRLAAALLLKGLEMLELEARGTESGGRTRRNAKQAA